jgi:hypothetical protein
MGRKAKRKRIVAKKTAANSITIRQVIREKDGCVWTTCLVQGWKENGKWRRKQFKDRKEAESFAALKRVAIENQGREQRMVLTPLDDQQLEEALQAFDQLGGTYTMSEAVEFFLKHHRAPDYTIPLGDAAKRYLHSRELDGLRPRTLQGVKSTLSQLQDYADNPEVHEITRQLIESFLRSRASRDGKGRARLKTLANYRGILHAFFDWCATADMTTHRPYVFQNPVVDVASIVARRIREEQDANPTTTNPEDVLRMFSVLLRWRGGVFLRYFAYAFFAGIRPMELKRLSPRESELVNLKTRMITIPAGVAKTRQERKIDIPENLAQWLAAAPAGPIIPTNFDDLCRKARNHFGLSHDEMRHSFISFHVALHRSIGDVALQAGNSEAVVKRHYLNLHPREEGESFFSIIPDMEARRAVYAQVDQAKPDKILRAV